MQLNKYEKRFHSKYIPVPESGCWLWEEGKVATSRPGGGYGLFYPGPDFNSGKQITAHRYSYFLHTGHAPTTNEHVLHKCDTPSCVNPYHLVLGTHDDNMKDRAKKNRVNASRKLSSSDALNAIVMYSLGDWTIVNLAKFYGMSPSHMGRVLKRYRRSEQ